MPVSFLMLCSRVSSISAPLILLKTLYNIFLHLLIVYGLYLLKFFRNNFDLFSDEVNMPEVIDGSLLICFILTFTCLTGQDISQNDLYIIMT